MMTSKTASASKVFRIAHNRGKPRVWIEGNFLASSGIFTGMRFDRSFDDGAMILTFNDEGKHKVSGTAARPIIDLNGAYLIDLFKLNEKIEADRATHYSATIYHTVAFEQNSLTIYIEGEIK
tara:strand:+ start:249 stop:614 length:366 start_codon:yes stop_codon:yes gene_type:complete